MLFYDNHDQMVLEERRRFSEAQLSGGIPDKGTILQTLLPGENQKKEENVGGYSITQEVDSISVDFLGIFGDRHRRQFRPSTGREKSLYPKGTDIRQHRHVMIVTPYDCSKLSELMGVRITPELLGANIVLGGREGAAGYSLSSLPQNTHLIIASEESLEIPVPPIAVLKHYTLQQGCGVTGKAIAERYRDKGLVKKFVEVAKLNRGAIFSVEYPVEPPAEIKAGQDVYLRFSKGISP